MTKPKRKPRGVVSRGCQAELWHGPGHQSTAHCQIKGKHVVHGAEYGCYEQYMEWRGKKACTGYFDEPTELPVVRRALRKKEGKR